MYFIVRYETNEVLYEFKKIILNIFRLPALKTALRELSKTGKTASWRRQNKSCGENIASLCQLFLYFLRYTKKFSEHSLRAYKTDLKDLFNLKEELCLSSHKKSDISGKKENCCSAYEDIYLSDKQEGGACL